MDNTELKFRQLIQIGNSQWAPIVGVLLDGTPVSVVTEIATDGSLQIFVYRADIKDRR